MQRMMCAYACDFQFNCTGVCPGLEHKVHENGITVCVPDEFAPR